MEVESKGLQSLCKIYFDIDVFHLLASPNLMKKKLKWGLSEFTTRLTFEVFYKVLTRCSSFIKCWPTAQIRSVLSNICDEAGCWPSFCLFILLRLLCSALLPLFVLFLKQNPLNHHQVAEVAEGRLSCLKTCPDQSFSFLWALLSAHLSQEHLDPRN